MSKKVLSLMLAIVMVFSSFSVTAFAASVPKVKNVTITARDDDEINLKWNKVKGATGYQVYVRLGSNGKWKKAETTKKNLAEVDDLKENRSYNFKVRAYTKENGKNVYGKFSAVIAAKTKKEPVPSNLITKAKAKSIALKNAGVKAKNIFDYEISLEKEKGIWVYEIDFETKKYEYEYEINAKSGKVIRKDIERR